MEISRGRLRTDYAGHSTDIIDDTFARFGPPISTPEQFERYKMELNEMLGTLSFDFLAKDLRLAENCIMNERSQSMLLMRRSAAAEDVHLAIEPITPHITSRVVAGLRDVDSDELVSVYNALRGVIDSINTMQTV